MWQWRARAGASKGNIKHCNDRAWGNIQLYTKSQYSKLKAGGMEGGGQIPGSILQRKKGTENLSNFKINSFFLV